MIALPRHLARAAERFLEGCRGGLDVVLSAVCVGCGRGLAAASEPLCVLCRHRLPSMPHPRCSRCGASTGGAAACGECAAWPAVLVGAAAPCVFDGVAADLVHALKYGQWRSTAGSMVDPMVTVAGPLLGRVERGGRAVLVPVPLSRARLRDRGFNQAAILAEGVAERIDRPVAHLLLRTPGGSRQAASQEVERRGNVQGRFRSSGSRPDGVDTAVIVDDVITTGATVLACASVLAEAGFQRIAALTFARTLRVQSRPERTPTTAVHRGAE